MAEGFVARGGMCCGVLHCPISHEEFGAFNQWAPDSFGPRGSNRVQAQPARVVRPTEARQAVSWAWASSTMR